MGLAAFVFFVVPWMAVAVWLFRLPGALRMGVAPTPWRPLTDFVSPGQDRRADTAAGDAPRT